MKNNKLIAEFMGLSIKEGVCYYTDADDMFPMGIEVEEPYLPYHTSWDWLMPVINKCLVGEAEMNEEISNTTIKNIYEGICNQDISQAYKSVITFIKTYNNER
jgi:hypothetical protein